MINKWLLGLLVTVMLSPAFAVIDTYQFQDSIQEQRFFTLTNELRCPKCQNQSIADSNAPIAQDLRGEVYRLLQEGADDQQVVDFMLSRYGDFVLYRPPLKLETLALWFGPLGLLLLGIITLIMIVRKHTRKKVVESLEVSDGLTQEQRQRLKRIIEVGQERSNR
ncbi:cytochrome c-type biogenesis protein CcmH [Endozoicomonas sp. Mp262]|uniref:cytochrome c-type biogenesis protein n=1 Tax=Endozoicomonas sp. Mp262 TaxID=2919499 RepID=UPI0021D7D668